MSEIVVGGHGDGRPDPPRLGLIVIGALALVGLLVLIGGVGQEAPPEETLEFSATTAETSASTTVPLDLAEPATVTLTLADLLRGPRFGWSEIVLPEELEAVFAVGEFRGAPALIRSEEHTSELQSH